MSIPVVGRSPIIDQWRGGGDGYRAEPFWTVVPSRRRRDVLKVAVLAFLAVLGVVLLAVQLMPARFAATSVLSIMPRPQSATTADTVELLGQKYVVLATSAMIMQTAGDAIPAAPEELVRATTVT